MRRSLVYAIAGFLMFNVALPLGLIAGAVYKERTGGDIFRSVARQASALPSVFQLPEASKVLPPRVATPPWYIPDPKLIPLRAFVRLTAERYQIDPKLVTAMIDEESGWDPRAVSRKGAQGLMQLMPETAAALGVRDPFDPYQNVEGGVRYLREQLDKFDNLALALAAYNAGPEAVEIYKGIPPYPETQNFVRKVLVRYQPKATS